MMDVRDSYNMIRIAEGDEWKMAFRICYGLFKLLVKPFGLAIAPASCQEFINDILRPIVDTFCTAFLDDILINSINMTEYKEHV
jgi:hypothetical protein